MVDSNDAVFSLSDVSKHNDINDCWIVVDDKVYDVTEFMNDHPGGEQPLLIAAGKDATRDFMDVGHSTSARMMMTEYYVGYIPKETVPQVPTSFTLQNQKQPQYKQDRVPKFIIKLLQFLLPLLFLAFAIAVRFYGSSTIN